MRFLCLFVVIVPAFAPYAHSQVQFLESWEGMGAGEQFSIALGLGGDANQDGGADLAVGSSTNDEGGNNAGKVSVFLGRAAPLATPDLELLGDPGSFFGAAVAWVGDVDNDGYDDLLVGAFRDSAAGTNAGKATLFLGGDPMDATPDLVLVGPGAGAYFGRAVCGVGDLNGDNYADFAVGAPRTTNGSVYLFFGGDPPESAPDLVLHGLAAGDRFGCTVAGPGNADALPGDDVLVGACRASVNRVWEGAAYLFSGSASMDTLADWSVHGEGAGDQLGTSVAGAGDANGDGEPDLILGAPYWNKGMTVDAGAAYLYYGGAILDTVADFVIEGSAAEENMGRSVAGCGDVTGSGFGHLLVGAPRGRLGGVEVGLVALCPGGDPPTSGQLIFLYGENVGDQFGYAVAGGACLGGLSFTGDLSPDMTVGAWAYGAGGKCYLYGSPATTSVGEMERDGQGLPGAAAFAKVWPNPAGAFHFSFTGSGARAPIGRATQVRIFDLTGRLVSTLPVSSDPGDGDVLWDGRRSNGRPARAGLYHYVIEGDSGRLATGRLTLIR